MCPSQGFDQFLHLRVAAITIGISTAAAPIHHQSHYAPAVTMTLPHTALIPTTHSFISSSIRSISVHNPEISCCCSVSRWASAGIVRFSFERSHGLGCVQLGLEGGVSVTSQVNMFSWGIFVDPEEDQRHWRGDWDSWFDLTKGGAKEGVCSDPLLGGASLALRLIV